MFQQPSLAVVLLSNGPGELTTWVKPIAEKLHANLSMRPKDSYSSICMKLVLVPCPNANGNEHEVAKEWEIFEQISQAKDFWKLLINPKKYGFWPSQGVVVFLGGDQFWSVLLSARLKYKNITYAEWVTRWPYWNDRIAAMSIKVKDLLPKKLKKRCTVVGDLMADLKIDSSSENILPPGNWVALLPGSKKAKLSIGIPFFLEVADKLSEIIPNTQFILPVAPTTNIHQLQLFSGNKNPIARKYKSGIKAIEFSEHNISIKKLITNSGTEIHLVNTHPAYEALIQCDLALTTVGANTAELGALCIPMIVIVPTQHLNVMEAWDGFLGILGRLPILKWLFGFILSIWRLRKQGYMAWPNISANRMVVPERIGTIYPNTIAIEASEWLKSPKRLKGQKEDLQTLRGKSGAVDLMIKEIISLLPDENI